MKRFISEDPVRLGGGLNVYAYVEGDPVGLVDPSGNLAQAIPYGLLGLGLIWAAQPKNLDSLEKRAWSKYCEPTKKDDDHCEQLKRRIKKELGDSEDKINAMKDDMKLWGDVGWWWHMYNLWGRLDRLWAMITLAQKLGCDVSEELRQAATLKIPMKPDRLL